MMRRTTSCTMSSRSLLNQKILGSDGAGTYVRSRGSRSGLVGSNFIEFFRARAYRKARARGGRRHSLDGGSLRVVSVLVIGGGVSGLSCALELRARGHEVRLWAERLAPDVTSSVAAAF